MAHKLYHQETTGMIAVVDSDFLYFMRDGKFYRVPHVMQTAGDVLATLEQYHLLTAWIVPESRLSHQNEAFIHAADRGVWDILVTKEEDGTIIALQGYRRSQQWQPSFYVVFPEYHGAWQPDNDEQALDNCTDATELYAALHYLERELGVPLKQSPGAVGLALLKKYVQPAWLAPTVPSDFLDTVTLAPDAIWQRPLTDDEKRMKYIHCIDKNSAYLASAATIHVGVGQPVRIVNPDYSKVDVTMPSVWHVTRIEGASIMDGKLLPVLAREGTWVWGTSMHALHQSGYAVECDEAYVWQSHMPCLQQWAKHVWNARLALKENTPGYRNLDAVRRAYQEIKVIATRAVGRFAMRPHFAQKSISTDFHPDWFAEIVDATAVTMKRRMKRLVLAGHHPFLVYTDGLYIVSDERNPHLLPELQLSTANMLGGYKHSYTVRLADVIDVIEQDDSEAAIISQMKKHILSDDEQ